MPPCDMLWDDPLTYHDPLHTQQIRRGAETIMVRRRPGECHIGAQARQCGGRLSIALNAAERQEAPAI